MKKFILENGKFGKRLILCSKFTGEIVRYCIENDIKELELNYAKGYKADNLSLLKNLNQLLAFEILDYPDYNLDEIHCLNNLKELSVSVYRKEHIDLSKFPLLEKLSLYWNKNISGFDKLKHLKNLFIYIYNPPTKDLSELSQIQTLETLSLKMPNITAIGNLENLSNLKFLGIYGGLKLQNIDGLLGLRNLETLDIDTCSKISNLDIIGRLTSLKKLSISNNKKIESLKPLCNLKNLSQLHFIESTNIVDGDISVLNCLPHLKSMIFQDRKHYNLKRCEF